MNDIAVGSRRRSSLGVATRVGRAVWLPSLAMSVLTACATTTEQAESSEDTDSVEATVQSLTAADDIARAVPASLAGNPDAMKLARVPPRTYAVLPKPKVTDWTGRSRTRIVVKFAEGSRLRLRGTQLAVDV